MGLLKASASVNAALDAEFAAALQGIIGDVDQTLRETANEVAAEAKRTTAFRDKTGTLRGRIRVVKSKFPEGGWLVVADSPHAHLVERGHLLVLKGKGGIVRVVGHVTAKPFMRPAADRGKASAIAKLKAAQNG